MHMTERNHTPETSASTLASFRALIMVTTALLVATLIASSAAHGMTLGDAVAQSALGSPLRVVIPIAAAPNSSLQPSCFRVVSAPGDGGAAIVTGRVSLERSASAARLVVTTQNSVNEPAIRFSIEGACDGMIRRVYVLLLDPPATGAVTATENTGVATREPGSERPRMQAATLHRTSGSAPRAEPRTVQLRDLADRPAPSTLGVSVPSAPERLTTDGVIIPAAFRQVTSVPAFATRADGSSLTAPRVPSGIRLWALAAVALALAGLIALVTLFARRRYAQPEVPQWTRGPSLSGPRTLADLSTAPVTVPNTLSFAGATTQRVQQQPPATASRALDISTSGGTPRHAAVDPAKIDTLLDEVDPDIVEERAIREAWAAARNDVEREMDGNAILQAIEAAERDLCLAPPGPVHSAIERALDDELLQPQRRR